MRVTEQSMPNLRKVGNAKFNTSRNDLFWSYHHYTDALVWLKLDWYGYNDQNWWDNVAPTKEARAKVGQDGKTYLIDFHTCEVFEVVSS